MAVVDAVNTILRALPARWPIPLPVATVAATLLTLAINSWVTYDMTQDATSNSEILSLDSKCQFTTFDYIIVGGGGAGMVVATRIANASSSDRILLLEAGGEPSVLNDIPGLDVYLQNQPGNTWFYNSTPQANACQNCDGKKVMTTRGKMLGGSTGTNFMMYVRGNKEDFNRWSTEDLGGDPQWNYENLLPYFKKSEDYNGIWTSDPDASKYHGKGGLRNVGTNDYMPGADELLAAAREKGYTIGDYNGANQEVFSKIDLTTQNGWRENTYRAYYKDTGKPSNLCIKKYAQVIQIKFKTVSGKPKAVGVIYKRQGLTRTATARKEIIMSAGTFGSAQVLMLSGVGPADHLESLNIPLVKDLPVGQNLQDHTTTLVGPFLKAPSLNPDRDITAQAAVNYLTTGNGVLASSDSLAGQGFFKSPVAEPDYADLQVVHAALALYPELPHDVNKLFGIRVDILERWFNPYHTLNTDARFGLLVLGRPKSFGNLTLASRNPDDNPIMDPQYLTHPDDLEAMLFGCENLVFKSDDYYRCVIRMFSFTLYHHVGTCALGKVVDSKLKVKGIDGLRVINASVMPRLPNGNTQAATIMIAEKGSDLIIADM
ncbi:Glucose dehydrogenase [FAD, quinone] [Orchesella cincta]|uniref:Glucose dehydrogenase [FAD, quinone] n=1 Tax=Orchesella cincta TaxID=48709 RepID=A0A1D2MD52_ORCCI|nr:Glucose dehydrogenase [FAD, quinone] [Orchesella cincta]